MQVIGYILITYVTMCAPAFTDSCVEQAEVRQISTPGECQEAAKKALIGGIEKAKCVPLSDYGIVTYQRKGDRIISTNER